MLTQHKLLVAPLAAVLIVGIFIWASYSATVPAVQFQTNLQITIVNQDLTSHNVLPTVTIGVPGGIMSTTHYLLDGLNGNYPLYSSNINDHGGTIVIHVQSRVARNYTLGDFFAVWGEPLGRNRTLTYSSNATVPAPPGTAGQQYFWDMCIITNGIRVPSLDWGNHALKDGETIDLLFSSLGCA